MKQQFFKRKFEKAFQVYRKASSAKSGKIAAPELYKNFWNIFLLGDAYFFIVDHRTTLFDMVSDEIEGVLGYLPLDFDLSFMISKIHPDDLSSFVSIGQSIMDFLGHLPQEKIMKYKIRYDFRMEKKNGEYARILYQGICLQVDEHYNVIKTLGVHTDISYLQHDGQPVLSFIGMDDEPSFHDVAFKKIFIQCKEDLTQREKEVLRLIIEGKLSKEIGDILKISKQTVDTHRKNMVRKKNLSNTGELIAKAIRLGWI
jgi:DNA-binding CsgD family transcriptional regulator